MKCLRALPLALAAEHSRRDDILLAAPGELLSIPMDACAERNNPHCQCRRVFTGIHTAQPATLARVCLGERDDLCGEADISPKIAYADDVEPFEHGIALCSLQQIAYAIRGFEMGAILRVNRTADAIYVEDTWHSAIESGGVSGRV